MKKIFNISALLAMCLMILAGCQEEMVSTDQYAEDGVTLKAFGPSPVMRGGELRFLGTNLDKVVEVLIPGVDPITEITVVKSGIPSEIRVTVPKEGPEPGFVTLKTADGKEIVTKTLLTFSEPIVIESLTPASVAPGETLTIKGDYFNLIHEVIFAEGVLVSEKDFKKHDRYEIQVVVPVEARTGVVGLGDLDELNNEDPELFANVIYSEEELIVAQPEVTKMEAPRYKAGETVKITGKNFQYVEALNLPGAAAVEFTKNAANTEITFVLPAAAQDGEAVLVAKSGVEVVAGIYETVVPTELAAAPQPVKAGAVLTVTGQDIDLVTGVDLPNAAGVEFQNAEAFTLTVPDTAQEGDVTLKMANGKSVTVAYTLVKPVVTELPASASAGSDMSITGTDLDLVKSVTFGGDLKVDVAAVDGTITVAVPTTAETGALKLNLANGTSVETESVTIDKPVACYITELPGEDVEVKGGTVLTVPVANEDKLTGVQINGEDVNYLLNKTDLYISLPNMAAEGTVIKLISSNGAVEYIIDCVPDNRVENVLPVPAFDLGAWGYNQEILGESLIAAGIESDGAVLRFYVTPTGGYAQLKIANANWEEYTTYKYNESEVPEVIEVPVTAELLDIILNVRDEWNSDRVLWIQGEHLIVNKIAVFYEISLEVTLWEGEALVDDWHDDYKPFMLSDAGKELKDAGAEAGQVVYFYLTPTESDWKLQIIEGHWGPTYASICAVGSDTEGGKFVEVDLAASGGKYGITLTQEMLDAAYTQQWWGGVFVMNGDNIKVTKITLE